MTVKEFGQCIEYNITHNLKHAVLGLGAPGVGKSQLIRQIGEKYGYKVIDLRLAQMSEVEIGGLIYPNEQRTKTIWLAPEVLPDEKRDGEKTILLLDEITSCTKRVQVAAYQLILDRRIGQYHLPEGTFVIALGNREDDDGVYIRLTGPLADRFEIHYLEPDFEDWKNDFAIPFGVHPFVIGYLSFKPQALHTQAAEPDSMVFATPRSWTRVSDILKFDANIENPVIRHKIIGNVGQVEGPQFIEYCRKQNTIVTPQEFITGTVPPPATPDALHILITSLVNLVAYLKDESSLSALEPEKRTQTEEVIRAMFRLGSAEYTVVGLKSLLDLNRPIIKDIFLELDDNTITDFVLEHAAILGIESVEKQLPPPSIFARWKK